MQKVLIYLHGFLSSPNSVKCQATKAYVEEHFPEIEFVAPQIPNYPEQAVYKLRDLVKQYRGKQIGYIGSSMGGFMATHLMEDYPGKAVLINPAINPHILLQAHLGEHVHPHTKKKFVLTSEHMIELKHLFVERIRLPQNYWVLLQKNDETLDYRLAVDKYRDGQLTVEEGGDHSFQGYEAYLHSIFEFLYPGIKAEQAANAGKVQLAFIQPENKKDARLYTKLEFDLKE